MRVFIQGVDQYVGGAVKRLLLADHAGKVEAAGDDAAEVEPLEIVGSVAFKPESQDGSGAVSGVCQAAWRGDSAAVCNFACSSDSIVLDTHCSVKEASQIVRALKDMDIVDQKSVVLISTLLAWDRTVDPVAVAKLAALEDGTSEEKLDDEDESGPIVPTFSEDDFHKRKPSPRFLLHKTLESQVLALAHDRLNTTVLASALLYGAEQNLLHSLFRDAWLGRSPLLPAINNGCTNVVPTVHVQDLARATCSAVAEAPSQQYIVVCDESRNTVSELVASIFSVVQPHAEITLMEVASSEEEVSEEQKEAKANAWREFVARPAVASLEETDDLLLAEPAWAQLDCHMAFDTAESAVHSLVEEWVSRQGMVDNITKVVEEYRRARDLRPVRVALIGPPCSGKSTLAAQIAEEYSLQVVDLESATAELLKALATTRQGRERTLESWKQARLAAKRQAWEAQRAAEQKDAEDGDEAKEADGDQTEETENLIELTEEDLEDPERLAILRKGPAEKLAERVELCLEKKQKLSNKIEAKVLRAKLLSSNCVNHGYILDGEAKSYGSLKRLFGVSAITDGLFDPETAEEGAENADADFEDEVEPTEAKPDEDGADVAAEDDEEPLVVDARLVPTAVLLVTADDALLRDRATQAVGDQARDEAAFEEALEEYKRVNADKLLRTPLSFFEGPCQLETMKVETDNPISFADEQKESESKSPESKIEESKESEGQAGNQAEEEMFSNIKMHIERGGRSFNYHPTEEELAEMSTKQRAAMLVREEEARKKRTEIEAQRKSEESHRRKVMEEHQVQIQKHEEELIDARSEPLRAYLLKHVMPTLSKGLIETCRVKPADPIDFLAEFLFKNSEEIETLYQ